MVVDIRRLTKRFGSVTALDGLDLTVARGQVHGFLGPNGAGKSTTIRVLLGLLRADDGHARLFGGDPWRDAVALHRRLAYVPGDVTLWPSLTGGEAIDVLASLRRPLEARRRAELIGRFDFDPTRRCRSYSKGNRQKVALIAALASDAELLVLDEPTSGLDPLMEATFQQCVREAADRGATVLLSSHILAEVEQLCDWVTIIRAGRLVRSGELAGLRELGSSRLAATTNRPAASELAGVPGVYEIAADGDRLTCLAEPAALAPAMAVLSAAGLRTLTCRPPSLEEIFFEYYERAAS